MKLPCFLSRTMPRVFNGAVILVAHATQITVNYHMPSMIDAEMRLPRFRGNKPDSVPSITRTDGASPFCSDARLLGFFRPFGFV